MAITIEILDGPNPIYDEYDNLISAAVLISLTDGTTTRTLNVGDLPSSVLSDPNPEAAALALLNERAQELWDAATPQKPRNPFNDATNVELARAIVEVMLGEINDLRGRHGLAPRTLKQAVRAIRNKLL